MKSNKIVILLTACVNPKGMAFTKIQDIQERVFQYSEALRFYLKETNYNIVIVENTLYDLGFNVNSSRIEYLTFNGNDYDKSLGKGFGEALIIDYALKNSSFLNDSDYIIKITGRLQVKNIIKIIKSLNLNDCSTDKVVFSNITWNMKFCYSHFFISNKFFLEFFLKSKKNINDSKSLYFEHVLMNSIINWKKSNHNFFVLKFPIIVNGFSGSTGKKYTNKTALSFLMITQYLKFMYFNFIKKWR